MAAELDAYIDTLDTFGKSLSGLNSGLKRARDAVKFTDTQLTKIQKVIDSAENLDDFAANMTKLIKVLKFFPPVRSIAKIAEDVIKAAKERSGDFIVELKKLDQAINAQKETLADWKTNLDTTIARVTEVKLAVDIAEAKMRAVDAVIDNFDASTAHPTVLQAIATIEAKLGQLNANLDLDIASNFSLPDLDAILANFDLRLFGAPGDLGLIDKIENLADLGAIFDSVAAAFDNVYRKLSFLDGPFDMLVDALEPVMWVLEKAESVISFILDPIIDPILDATGITAMVDKLKATIQSLLPSLSVLDPFDNIQAQIDELLAEFDLMTEIDALADLFGQAGGFLQALGQSATSGNDLFLPSDLPIDLFDVTPGFTFDGLAGDDVIRGGRGDDTLSGGAGADFIIATGGNDVIDGGLGDADLFALSDGFSDYNLSFVDLGGGNFEFLITYIGADPTKVGTSRVSGTELISFAGVTFAASALATAQKVNYLSGNTLQNTGTDGAIMLGAEQADSIIGSIGDDTVTGFAGRDTIDGGQGVDTVDYSSQAAGASVLVKLDPTLVSNADFELSSEYDELSNVENVVGAETFDYLFGDDLANRLSGRGGADIILGFGGDDIINGGAGADFVLSGGDGDDTLIGGAGIDRYFAGRGADTYEDDGVNETDFVFYGDDGEGYLQSYLLQFDPGAINDMPDQITAFLDPDGGTVLKYFGTVQEYDRLNGNFSVHGTSGDDFVYVDGGEMVVYGHDGRDSFRGLIPDLAVVPEYFGETKFYGGDGFDNFTTFTGDESFWGEGSDDSATLIIKIGEDYTPEADDVLEGVTILNEGARVRQLHGGDGFDQLNLSQSDLNWSLVLTQTGLGGTLVSSTGEFGVDGQIALDEQLDFFEVSGWDLVYGGTGDETIRLLAPNRETGDFTFFGGGGNDRVFGAGGYQRYDMYVRLGDGDDLVETGHGDDTVWMNGGNDTLVSVGNPNGDVEFADLGDGNDLAMIEFYPEVASFSDRTLLGGAGIDTFSMQKFVSPVSVSLNGANTATVIWSGIQIAEITDFEVILGSNDSNTIIGNDGANIISGGAGTLTQASLPEDYIDGGGGNDILFSGTSYYYGYLEETILGGAGDDLIHVPNGRATVDGGDGYDVLKLAGWIETSALSGYEIVYYRNTGGLGALGWVVDLGTPEGQVAGWQYTSAGAQRGNISITGIERLIGGLWGDHITAASADAEGNGSNIGGFDGNDTLVGLDGIDTLSGDLGNDLILGGAGDDFLTPGVGNDRVYGGEGIDTLDLRNSTAGAEIEAAEALAAGPGTPSGFSLAALDGIEVEAGFGAARFVYVQAPSPDYDALTLEWFTRFTGIETFNLSDSSDTFLGSGANETVYGFDGDDSLRGAGGADTLFGGLGDDTLAGGGPDAAPMGLVAINRLNTLAMRDEYITVPGAIPMPTSALTVEFLINAELPPAGAEAYCLMSYGVQSSTNEFTLFVTEANGLAVLVNGVNHYTGVSADSFLDGETHRLGIGWDVSTGVVTVYLDGNEVASEAVISLAYRSPMTSGGRLFFGQDQDGATPGVVTLFEPDQAFIGGLGDIRIWSEVRSESDVQAQAFQSIDDPASEADLVHYWKADTDTQKLVTAKGSTAVLSDELIWNPTPVGPDLLKLSDIGQTEDYLFSNGAIAMPTNAWTIEMLIRNDNAVNDQALLGYGVPGATNEVLIIVSLADGLALGINNNIIVTGVTAAELFDGSTKRLSVTWDSVADTAEIFIDGVSEALLALGGALADPVASGGRLYVGQDIDGSDPTDVSTFDPNQSYRGFIGDIRIYDTALDQPTIFNRAFVELNDPANTANLVHYWTVDAGSQTVETQKGTELLSTSGTSISSAPPAVPDGADSLDGGEGSDVYFIDLFDFVEDTGLSGEDSVILAADESVDVDVTQWLGIERVEAGDLDDRLDASGAVLGMTLVGGAGADELIGGAGGDVLLGDDPQALADYLAML